jgi:hypothetical protein
MTYNSPTVNVDNFDKTAITSTLSSGSQYTQQWNVWTKITAVKSDHNYVAHAWARTLAYSPDGRSWCGHMEGSNMAAALLPFFKKMFLFIPYCIISSISAQ